MSPLDLRELINKLKKVRPIYLAKEDNLAIESIDIMINIYLSSGKLSESRIAFAQRLVKKFDGLR